MKIPGYEVLDRIGVGGMGAVYRARTSRGAVVAVKVLTRLEPAARARFDRERRLLAKLGAAEGFVPLLDSGDADGLSYLVMPLLGGGTLRDRLRRGPLPVAEAAALAVRLARALAAAHAAGIVHRDLKPENVLYDEQGAAFVADLGIAKRFGPSDRSAPSIALSKTGDVLGTFGYMSPDQFEDAKSAGPRADVYAWGAVIWECLAGRAAFAAPTLVEIAVAQTEGRVEPLAKVRPETPRAFAALVEKTLRSNEGPGDGGALLAAVERSVGHGRGRIGAIVAALLLLALVVVAAAVGGHGGAAGGTPASAGTASAPPAAVGSALPARCRAFERSRLLRLAGFHGTRSLVHLRPVAAVAFAADGPLAASASHDGTVRLWDTERRTPTRTLVAGAPLMALAFLPGDRFVTCDIGGTLRFWDARKGEGGRSLEAVGVNSRALATSSDGRRVLAGFDDGHSRLWDADSGALLRKIAGHEKAIRAVALSPDGLRALTASEDDTARIWDLSEGQEIFRLPGHEGRVNAGAFLPSSGDGGTRVLTGGESAFLRISDAATGAEVARLPGVTSHVISLAVSRDGTRAVSGGMDGKVQLWDLKERRLVRTAVGHRAFVMSVAISPDGHRALSGGEDEAVRLWDVATGAPLPFVEQDDDGSRYAGHRAPIKAIAVSSDGTRAVTAGLDSRALLWDPAGPTLLGPLEGHTNLVMSADISPDGRSAITGSYDETARIWDLATRQGRVLPGKGSRVNAVLFAADGRAVVAGDDALVRIVDTGTLAVVHEMRGHVGGVLSLARVPGSRLIVSGGGDHTVRTWDPVTGVELEARRLATPAPVTAVACGADGRVFAAGPTSPGGDVTAFGADGLDRRVLASRSELPPIAVLSSKLLLCGDGRELALFDLDAWKVADRLDLAEAHADITALAAGPRREWFLAGDSRGELLRFEVIAK